MLRLIGRPTRLCDGTTRREFMQAGGLSLFSGLTLPRFLAAREPSAALRPAKAHSVIVLNLFGGPSHLDTFDLKPDAPLEIRGEFKPIATSVPGLSICELLPQSAARMHRATLIRTHSHPYNSHNPYNVLTGFSGGDDRENYFAKRTDHPSIGCVMQHAGIRGDGVPPYIFMPAHPGYSQALRRAGPYGGYLGTRYDPAITLCEPTFAREADPEKTAYDPIPPIGQPILPSADALPDITLARLGSRRSLLGQFDRCLAALDDSPELAGMDACSRQAFDLLTSSRTRDAFDLAQEPDAVRGRYGRDLFGTSMLVARRLVEAGVKFIGITTESRGAGHWDSHENNFGMLRDFNLPNLDQIYAALTDDLADRGLLAGTLVVVMGEMGRTPRINAKAGRDHWPQCGFALLTGGGVKEGLVHGGSDKQGAYPASDPVSSGDIAATIYQLVGVDPDLMVDDLSGRPIPIAHGGAPIHAILA
jgi:hypothetical protein